jgi:Trehalose-phosphatase
VRREARRSRKHASVALSGVSWSRKGEGLDGSASRRLRRPGSCVLPPRWDADWRGVTQGVSKGGMVERILAEASRGEAVEFVLCIGDDRSDEDMFVAMEHMHFSPHMPAEVRARRARRARQG